MSLYIGSALCFNIHGREEVGMKVFVDSQELVEALEKFQRVSPYDREDLEITILPLKPENVIENVKTHSVKLTNIVEHETRY